MSKIWNVKNLLHRFRHLDETDMVRWQALKEKEVK